MRHDVDACMIAAARACLGTPFHHQGRLPQVGLDCIGLVVVALRASGCAVQDRLDYDRQPQGEALRHALQAHGATSIALPRAGAIALFAFAGAPQHVALCTAADMMIHAYATAGCVVETQLNAVWRRRLAGLYSFQER
jgi:cell wall-associated NlpC family hydrolase